MRLLRLLSYTLALAVMAAAPPTSFAQTGTQQATPSTPGQAPVNPIQDATQPSSIQSQQQQQQQQQQAEAAKGKPSTFDIGAAGGGQQDQELGEVRMMTRYTQIGPDCGAPCVAAGTDQGRLRSFHTQGQNDLGEFNYFIDRNFFDTGHRFQFLSMFRGTDDTSIDPERNSVQKGFLRFYGPHDELILGDALVNYSRLSFNQNVKGASGSFKLSNKWKLSATGGVFIDRWGSLFKDQPDLTSIKCTGPATPTFGFVTDGQCGRPYAAAVTGARLEYALKRDSAIGFNFSSSNDLVDTRRLVATPAAGQPFPAPSPAQNRVGSVDMKYQVKGLRLDGEYAYSATNFDTRAITCTACLVLDPVTNTYVADPTATSIARRSPTPGLGMQGDWGARLEASYRWHKFNFRSSYVRYQPNFASINARQIADLQDVLFRLSYDATNWLTVDGTMRRNNNNLKGQLPYETVIWGPEARVILHDFSFYRRASLEMGYRHRIIDGSSATLQTVTTGGVTSLAPGTGCVAHSQQPGQVCLDRIQRQPYAEITLPISTTFLTVGYERRQSIDHLQVGQDNNTGRFYGSLRGIYDLAGWHISPNFRYELERQTHRLDQTTFLGLTPTQVQYVNPFQLLFLDHDTNRLGTASLLVEAPKWFILETQFRDTSATITTPATLNCSALSPPCTANQQLIVNGASGYSRPSYRVALTYKLMNDENKVLIFSFERTNNFYFSPPTTSGTTLNAGFPPGGAPNVLNFDERIAGVTLVYKFGKRGR